MLMLLFKCYFLCVEVCVYVWGRRGSYTPPSIFTPIHKNLAGDRSLDRSAPQNTSVGVCVCVFVWKLFLPFSFFVYTLITYIV